MTTRWWGGPLDVERLALEAVQAACRAAGRVADARGATTAFTTSPAHVAGAFAAVENLVVDGRSPEPWAPLSGFARAADGCTRLHANYPHHADALRAALGVTDRASLDARAEELPAGEIEQRVTAAGGIATVVRTEQEWAAHPHALATSTEPWVRSVVTGPRTPLPHDGRLLADVRVLDLTRVIAGPTCAQLLACLGADVLRVDPPQHPELLDAYLSNGMGKRSTTLDLDTHLDVVRRELLPRADVVLCGYRPGALDRYGLDPTSLHADHPDLVVGLLSAWGPTGPWAARRGFDSIVQAATGIADVCRGEDGRPGALPVQALDHAAGHRLAAGVLGLLADGRAGTVEVSLLGAARELLSLRRPTPEGPQAIGVEKVRLPSAYGPVETVPPAVLADGRAITAPLTPYGTAEPRWL